MNLKEVLESGDIAGAIQETTLRVKQAPSDAAARYLLAELCCVNAEWERADKHLELIYRQQEKLTPQVTVFRQLLRAAKARDECFESGRLPLFQQQPGPVLELHLRAVLAVREGDPAEARRLLDEAESRRVTPHGNADGQEFEDLRDLDDLTSSFMEVMTATGEYYWFPFEQLTHVEFSEVNRLRDMLWRPARMVGIEGPVGNVYLPGLYPGSQRHDDPQVRLGGITDWTGGGDEPTRGVGRRMWLIGERDVSILEINRLTMIAAPISDPRAAEG